MSILPSSFFREFHGLSPMWRNYPVNRWFNDFGLGLYPRDVFSWSDDFRDFERRAREVERRLDSEFAQLAPTIGKEGFQACIDVHQFSPNEITVKTVDNSVIVEGKHEERPDEHGFISRQFTRRYELPNDYDVNSLTSELSSDGVLTVKAPPPKSQLETNERRIPIQHTGPARLHVKENKPEALEEETSK